MDKKLIARRIRHYRHQEKLTQEQLADLAGISEAPEQRKEKLLSVTLDDICRVANQTVYDTCFFINGTLEGVDEEVTDNE